MDNDEDKTFQLLKYGKCDRCGNVGTELHTCPFSEEIHENYDDVCNCCSDCTHECAMDI